MHNYLAFQSTNLLPCVLIIMETMTAGNHETNLLTTGSPKKCLRFLRKDWTVFYQNCLSENAHGFKEFIFQTFIINYIFKTV